MGDAELMGGRRSARLLDLRSGGWVLVAAGLIAVLLLSWALWGAGGAGRRRGDGRTVASYGFDLKTCRVPRGLIAAAGFPRDGLPVLANPRVLTIAESEALAADLRAAHAGKLLVSSDLVIGVEVEGCARAYPLRFMTWHEVVNDTLGGRPIVVTYNPLCDSSVVCDRRVGGRVLEFGISGLVYNSNSLLYDRAADAGQGGESLWSPLECRAIAGPAAERGERLTLVPAVRVHWSDWKARYPETTLLAPDRARLKLYKRSYDAYFASTRLHFPVAPLPPPGSWPLKTPIVALRTGATSNWRVIALSDLAAGASRPREWIEAVDGANVRMFYRSDPPALWPALADDPAAPLECIYAFWFAWYATHADDRASTAPPAAAGP